MSLAYGQSAPQGAGASTATAAVFARISIPELLRYKYQPGIAAAVVAAGGTLASLIPPSAIMVVYGIITETSIGGLLLAGFIPGVISAVLYASIILVRFIVITPSSKLFIMTSVLDITSGHVKGH